jgi:intraflagellar transport protein 140
MPNNSSSADSIVEKRAVRDFEGIKDSDPITVKATIDFSFYLSMGNMDEAFKCIHAIKNKSVWEHMAKICVKTKRIDVAMICLSNIGNAHAIRAIKEAKKEKDGDVQVAILAAHLGMMIEAEQLLTACGRFDILNRIQQASGNWEKAIETSGTNDRINLKNTYYNYGRYLVQIEDVNGSLAALEKTAAYGFEIPRMLMLRNGELETYITSSGDKVILSSSYNRA